MILACLFLSLEWHWHKQQLREPWCLRRTVSRLSVLTVRVVGASAGAVTDADGKFSISMPAGQQAESNLGMVGRDVTVKGNSVRVVLVRIETNLDEVMVVAYGTAKKSAFTGSAAVVKSG